MFKSVNFYYVDFNGGFIICSKIKNQKVDRMQQKTNICVFLFAFFSALLLQ